MKWLGVPGNVHVDVGGKYPCLSLIIGRIMIWQIVGLLLELMIRISTITLKILMEI